VASTGMMGSSVSSKSFIASSFSSTSKTGSFGTGIGAALGTGATLASSTAGMGTCGFAIGLSDSATGAALLDPLRVKTVMNLSKARPKLDRLAARSLAGELSWAAEGMVVVVRACQITQFLSQVEFQ
jgi:hypothetical protein